MIGCHWAARTADVYEYRCAEYEYEYEEQPIASKLGCCSYSVRFATILVSFFAFPCTAVLIHRVIRLDFGQAKRAVKNPFSRCIDPNAV